MLPGTPEPIWKMRNLPFLFVCARAPVERAPVMINEVQCGWSDSGRWDGKELIRLQCPNCGRRTVLHPELLKQVLDMLFHGAGAHLRDLADFGVGLAASEPGEHFSLSFGQICGQRRLAGG